MEVDSEAGLTTADVWSALSEAFGLRTFDADAGKFSSAKQAAKPTLELSPEVLLALRRNHDLLEASCRLVRTNMARIRLKVPYGSGLRRRGTED